MKKKKKIKNLIVSSVMVILFLALGFQFWIIRNQGYEIMTLLSENNAIRADF